MFTPRLGFLASAICSFYMKTYLRNQCIGAILSCSPMLKTLLFTSPCLFRSGHRRRTLLHTSPAICLPFDEIRFPLSRSALRGEQPAARGNLNSENPAAALLMHGSSLLPVPPGRVLPAVMWFH